MDRYRTPSGHEWTGPLRFVRIKRFRRTGLLPQPRASSNRQSHFSHSVVIDTNLMEGSTNHSGTRPKAFLNWRPSVSSFVVTISALSSPRANKRCEWNPPEIKMQAESTVDSEPIVQFVYVTVIAAPLTVFTICNGCETPVMVLLVMVMSVV